MEIHITLKNRYNRDFMIGHFQGKDNNSNMVLCETFFDQVETHKHDKLVCPDDLTIITTYTDKSLCYIAEQLDYNGIKYINSAEGFDGKWSMPEKVKMIYTALQKVDTKYVLILDGYDTLIYTLDGIIEKFKQHECGLLYNASKNNYPNCSVDKMPIRDYIGPFKYFNAGCCIGYTNQALNMYKCCLDFMERKDYSNPYNSEQFVLRNIFAQCSENMLNYGNPVNIDYNCNIFCCVGNGILYEAPESTNENKVYVVS